MLDKLLDAVSYDDPRYREICRLVRDYIREEITREEFIRRFREITEASDDV